MSWPVATAFGLVVWSPDSEEQQQHVNGDAVALCTHCVGEMVERQCERRPCRNVAVADLREGLVERQDSLWREHCLKWHQKQHTGTHHAERPPNSQEKSEERRSLTSL